MKLTRRRMSGRKEEFDDDEDWEDPEELPLAVAGRSFSDLLESQLLQALVDTGYFRNV